MKFLSSHIWDSRVISDTDYGKCYWWKYGTLHHWYFPFKPPSANEWGDKKRAYKKAMYRNMFNIIFNSLLYDAERPIHNDRKASIRFIIERRRLLDFDNFSCGLKPLVDAMRDTNILNDDSPYWLSSYFEQYQSHKCTGMDIFLTYEDK